MMKTQFFRKALSVICVLSMLLSVCVVGFSVSASAATTEYTFKNAGKTYYLDLEAGAALPDPELINGSSDFLGWYDAGGTQYTTAGAVTTLYARYNLAAQSFDDGKGYFSPAVAFGTGLSVMEICDDPLNTYAGNKVLKVKNEQSNGNGLGFAISSTYDGSEGVRFNGKRLVISFKAYFAGLMEGAKYDFAIYSCARENIGKAGGKTRYESVISEVDAAGYVDVTIVTSAIAADAAQPYMYMTCVPVNSNIVGVAAKGYCYIDDFSVSEYNDVEVTFYDKGVKTVKSMGVGSALPKNTSGAFIGWYDTDLVTKYTVAPATDKVLVARYNGTFVNFEQKGYYDPNNKLGSSTSISVVTDPLAKQGKVAKIDLVDNSQLINFAPAGAEGATAGLGLAAGEYKIKFKYYATEVNSAGVYFEVRMTDDAGIGQSGGNKSNALTTIKITENTDGWVYAEGNFTIDAANAAKDSLVLCIGDGMTYGAATGTADDCSAIVYVDEIDVSSSFSVTGPTFDMDFEDDFAWSVAGANNYTESSGNGYVNRGKIVTEANGNHYFQMKHFGNKNGNFYFTVNDGNEQFKLKTGGIYIVEFDYFVQHSETPTQIGVGMAFASAESTGNFAFEPMASLDSFNYRDDTGAWSHASYILCAENGDAPLMNSVAIYVFNSTNVIEQYASVINFDNIKVTTLSVAGDDGILIFDGMHADNEVDPMVLDSGYAAGTLPTPTKFGYDFAGWRYTDNSGTHVFDENTVVTPGITNLFAEWTLQSDSIELNFRSNIQAFDDNTLPVVAKPGQPIRNIPESPSASGQTFVGWYLDTGFTKPLDPNSAPDKSCDVFARWGTSGIVIDYEQYANKTHTAARLSDRYSIVDFGGSKALKYNLAAGSNTDPQGAARSMFYTGEEYVGAFANLQYDIEFDYYTEKCNIPGQLQIYTTAESNTWNAATLQSGVIKYTERAGEWLKGKFSFVSKNAESDERITMSLAVSGDAIIYFDNFIIKCSENALNHYGSAIILNSNGGDPVNTISGEPGEKVTLPRAKRAGYLFSGWYTDITCTTPYTGTTFGDELIQLFAGWKLGSVTEHFENYPASIKALAVSGAYKFYDEKAENFDASNIHGGKTALFRDGDTTGDKLFTLSREEDIKLDIGSDYTLTLWVKVTSVNNSYCSISLYNIPSFTGITKGVLASQIATVSDLKEGEWQKLTLNFTATSEYIAISTGHGCDMYLDDINITLDGYTGSDTGDSSVSPVVILALAIIAAGALVITAKKVFVK